MEGCFQSHKEEKREDRLLADLNMAKQFLSIISQIDESEEFTFQLFPEGQRHDKAYATVLHGSLYALGDRLIARNSEGCGVYVTINRTDGLGKNHPIKRES